MSDSDQHSVLLEISRTKGDQALLTQKLDASISTMSSYLQALQGDMRGVQDKLDSVVHHQSDFVHYSSGLERLRRAVEALPEEKQKWRDNHERDNKIVSDQVTSHSTGIKVIWVMFTILVGLLMALNNAQFSRIDSRMTDLLDSIKIQRDATNHRLDVIESDVRLLQQQRGVLSTP